MATGKQPQYARLVRGVLPLIWDSRQLSWFVLVFHFGRRYGSHPEEKEKGEELPRYAYAVSVTTFDAIVKRRSLWYFAGMVSRPARSLQSGGRRVDRQ